MTCYKSFIHNNKCPSVQVPHPDVRPDAANVSLICRNLFEGSVICFAFAKRISMNSRQKMHNNGGFLLLGKRGRWVI